MSLAGRLQTFAGVGGFDFVVASGSLLLGSAEAEGRAEAAEGQGGKGVKGLKGAKDAAGGRISYLVCSVPTASGLRPIARFRRGS